MKLVVLDGYTLNPGDLDWTPLSTFADYKIYERTAPEQVVERIGDCELVLTNKTVIDKSIMDACPNLRYIGVLATGYNVVDIAYAAQKGIFVTNIPAYATKTVAQHTFALLLELTNQVARHADSVREGVWTDCPDFSYQLSALIELEGKTLGLIGYGSIGKAVAKIAHAFGMRVITYTRTPQCDAYAAYCDLDTLLAESDVVSLHCPLTDANKLLINQNTISKMKDGALLINTARGGLIDEAALCDALNTGKLGGAAADVVSMEPIRPDNPLLKAKNMHITPHNAWAAKEARQRLLDTAVDNIAQYLSGAPVNVINQNIK